MPAPKLDEEWLLIRYFREKCEAFPKGKLIKSESPDFILKTSRKKKIGIELTRLDYLIGESTNLDKLYGALQDLIAKKEDKLPVYGKKQLNEYWLIITVDSLDSFVNTGNLREKRFGFSTSFNRLFLFELFSSTILELMKRD